MLIQTTWWLKRFQTGHQENILWSQEQTRVTWELISYETEDFYLSLLWTCNCHLRTPWQCYSLTTGAGITATTGSGNTFISKFPGLAVRNTTLATFAPGGTGTCIENVQSGTLTDVRAHNVLCETCVITSVNILSVTSDVDVFALPLGFFFMHLNNTTNTSVDTNNNTEPKTIG